MRSNQLCLFFLGVSTAGVAAFVSKPSQKGLFYLFNVFVSCNQHCASSLFFSCCVSKTILLQYVLSIIPSSSWLKWGACGGWKYTVERFITITIIPEGQDAELMGMYLFAGQILSWLPPLVFTVMNEAGVSIRISMISLLLFWLVAIICLQCMGYCDNAVSATQESQPTAVTELESEEQDTSDKSEKFEAEVS